jgi:hypothetical protein
MIRRNSEGQITFEGTDRQEVVDALKEIFATEIGQDYRDNYYTAGTGDEDLEKILRAAQLVTGSPNITVASMKRGLELLIDSGDLKPKDFSPSAPLEEPVEDTRPRDRNGKLLSEAQLKWSEYRKFAETASSAEIKRRKQTDGSFANFVRKSLEREMGGGVGDAVTPIGTPTSRVAPTAELIDFARKYQVEPTQNLKPKGGYVRLGGEQIPYGTYLDLVNRAAACGLLL